MHDDNVGGVGRTFHGRPIDRDFGECMATVAAALFGKPNPHHSKPGKPRWGSHGSLSINERRGVWYDHEAKEGGGVLDLIEREKGLGGREAIEWMKSIGCRIDDDALAEPNGSGVQFNGAQRPNTPRQVSAKLEMLETYDYQDSDGSRLFQTLRYCFRRPDGELEMDNGKLKKTFRQRRPDPDDPKVWVWGLSAGEYMRRGPGRDWYRFDEGRWAQFPSTRERKTISAGVKAVPYRLPDVIDAATIGRQILIVEGEQKADLLARWNIRATCNAEGAGKWTAQHSAYLRGADAIILPDHDERGCEHADLVARSVQGIAAKVRIVELPGLGPKEDIVEWAKGHTREELDGLIERAPEWKAGLTSSQSRSDPYPLPAGLLPVAAFDYDLLPVSLRPWVKDVCERMQVPPDFVAVSVMTALGSVISRQVAIRPMTEDDWTVVPNMWGMAIGRPGIMKSPAIEEALRPLKRLAATARENHKVAMEKWLVSAKVEKMRSDANLADAAKLIKDNRLATWNRS
jgi:hypothetical protein